MAFKSIFFKNKSPTSEATGDIEEDGFVVIGKTLDEKSTITPDHPDYNKDTPPEYQAFLQASQPTSSEHNRLVTTIVPQKNPPLTPKCNGIDNKPASYIEDVPFQLDPSVSPALNFGRSNIDIGDEMALQINSHDYEYDFRREYEILREVFAND